eukprot:1570760-Rhodomonas_salina.5
MHAASIPVGACELRERDAVEIVGLAQARELNGRKGELGDFDDATCRWEVVLQGGARKSVKPGNLRQDVGVAAPQNKRLPPSEHVAYEDAHLWLTAACCVLPIEASKPTGSDVGLTEITIMNGERVEQNKIKSNVHGDKVFVVKVQFTSAKAIWAHEQMMNCLGGSASGDSQTPPGPRKPGSILLYDQIRTLHLNVKEDESGDRKTAFDQLACVAEERGGSVGSSRKVFLFAKRQGPALRVFLARLPSQAQPF